MKTILSSHQARKALLAGMGTLAEAVAATLGPQGRNAVIHIGWGQIPASTRDGVTVAKAIDINDPVADAGAQLLKHVASRTAEAAGDGTTTATVLAYAICREGIKAIEEGANPVTLKKEILAAASLIAEYLKCLASPVHGDKISQVATISANNDEKLGKLIAGAIRSAGSHGIITVEDSNSLETTVESAEGMRISSGWASPYFVNDQARQEFRAEDCQVLIFERKLGNLSVGIQEALRRIAATRDPLLILAESVEGDMLATLVANRLGNERLPQLPWCAARLPQGTSRDFLHDIAAVVGGTAITEDRGISDEETLLRYIGRVKSVRVTKYQTIIVGHGRTERIDERISSISTQLQSTEDPIERDRFQERLARLSGGVSIIRVGAPTEVELREKKARIEDAIHATKAAIEEGVLPGGGLALFIAHQSFAAANPGSTIVRNALLEPMRRIVENAGESFAAIFSKTVSGHVDSGDLQRGYNALSGEFENLVDAGVLDPLKVTRTALLNAASLAAMVLVTESLIVNVDEPTALVPQRPF